MFFVAPISAVTSIVLFLGFFLVASGASAQVTGPLDRGNTTVTTRAAPGTAATPAARELRCRGGLAFAVWNGIPDEHGPRQGMAFSYSASPAGADGRSFQAGSCIWADGARAPDDLVSVVFPATANPAIGEYLRDANNYWSFQVDGREYGWYLASRSGPWRTLGEQVASRPAAAAAGAQQVATTASTGNVFDRGDDELVVVGGQRVPAGDLKREIQPDLDALVRAPVATTRKPSAEGSPGAASAAGAVPNAASVIENPAAGLRTGAGTASQGNELDFAGGEKLNCDREPPVLGRVYGTVAPGAQITLLGFCLGDANGRIEAIGQVPGGRLTLPIVVWRHDLAVVTVPALTGTLDQTLAISAVRADGVASAPLQARMRVPRERVAVPASRWFPRNTYDSTYGDEGENYAPFRRSTPDIIGATETYRVSINPACALEGMQAVAAAGEIVALQGFENGPAHESTVSVESLPSCSTIYRHIERGPLSPDSTWYRSVCRTSYALDAVAYCPAGTAP